MKIKLTKPTDTIFIPYMDKDGYATDIVMGLLQNTLIRIKQRGGANEGHKILTDLLSKISTFDLVELHKIKDINTEYTLKNPLGIARDNITTVDFTRDETWHLVWVLSELKVLDIDLSKIKTTNDIILKPRLLLNKQLKISRAILGSLSDNDTKSFDIDNNTLFYNELSTAERKILLYTQMVLFFNFWDEKKFSAPSKDVVINYSLSNICNIMDGKKGGRLADKYRDAIASLYEKSIVLYNGEEKEFKMFRIFQSIGVKNNVSYAKIGNDLMTLFSAFYRYTPIDGENVKKLFADNDRTGKLLTYAFRIFDRVTQNPKGNPVHFIVDNLIKYRADLTEIEISYMAGNHDKKDAAKARKFKHKERKSVMNATDYLKKVNLIKQCKYSRDKTKFTIIGSKLIFLE